MLSWLGVRSDGPRSDRGEGLSSLIMFYFLFLYGGGIVFWPVVIWGFRCVYMGREAIRYVPLNGVFFSLSLSPRVLVCETNVMWERPRKIRVRGM